MTWCSTRRNYTARRYISRDQTTYEVWLVAFGLRSASRIASPPLHLAGSEDRRRCVRLDGCSVRESDALYSCPPNNQAFLYEPRTRRAGVSVNVCPRTPTPRRSDALAGINTSLGAVLLPLPLPLSLPLLLLLLSLQCRRGRTRLSFHESRDFARVMRLDVYHRTRRAASREMRVATFCIFIGTEDFVTRARLITFDRSAWDSTDLSLCLSLSLSLLAAIRETPVEFANSIPYISSLFAY